MTIMDDQGKLIRKMKHTILNWRGSFVFWNLEEKLMIMMETDDILTFSDKQEQTVLSAE